MLNVFRENLRHLKWVLLLVVASFILAIFAVWGGGVGTRDAGNAGTPWAAKVDDDIIGLPAFQREARNLEATYQQLLGAQYPQQRSFIKVGRMAVSNLVDRALISREADKAGLLVSDQEVAEAIMKEPALQQNGVFIGRERYEQMFRANQASVQAYEQEVKENLLISKFRNLIQDSVRVGAAEVREAYARQSEKVTIEYVLFEAKKLSSPSPTEAMIRQYYQQHVADYQSGEGRSGQFALFDIQALASRIDVPEAEVRSEYLQSLKTLFTVPEKRRASHILLKVAHDASPEEQRKAEDRAGKALARVRGGEDFARVAREVSEDSSASAGGDLNYFSRDQMVREFADATWSLKVGQVSGLVRSPYGFHIIRLTDVQPGKELTLEEARPQILSRLKAERARTEAHRLAQALAEKARSAGGDLQRVARESSIALKDFQGVHRGEAVAGLGTEPTLEESLFTLRPGEVSDPVAVAAGVAVVRFTSATPSAPLPLEKVRERVVRDLTEDRQVESARQMLSAAGGASNLAAAARKLKLELKTAGPLSRSSPVAELGSNPDLISRLFSLRPGEVSPPLATPSGVAVIRLVSHSDPMEGFEAQKDAIRDSLLFAKRDRFFRAYLERLRSSSRVEINTALVDEVDRT